MHCSGAALWKQYLLPLGRLCFPRAGPATWRACLGRTDTRIAYAAKDITQRQRRASSELPAAR